MPSPNLALEAFEFADADAAEFGKAVAEIAKTEKNVVVFGICFGNEPSGRACRIEEFDDRPEIALGLGALHLGLFAAVGEKFVAQFFGEELHGLPPSRSRTRWQ